MNLIYNNMNTQTSTKMESLHVLPGTRLQCFERQKANLSMNPRVQVFGQKIYEMTGSSFYLVFKVLSYKRISIICLPLEFLSFSELTYTIKGSPLYARYALPSGLEKTTHP